mmetsp:Transcript_18085/g.45338  ORF Transcript_18085/g.45338 Transcript_18085/m.45338 type:complete len:211 (+) Transcript_18085:5599-6231(+)
MTPTTTRTIDRDSRNCHRISWLGSLRQQLTPACRTRISQDYSRTSIRILLIQGLLQLLEPEELGRERRLLEPLETGQGLVRLLVVARNPRRMQRRELCHCLVCHESRAAFTFLILHLYVICYSTTSSTSTQTHRSRSEKGQRSSWIRQKMRNSKRHTAPSVEARVACGCAVVLHEHHHLRSSSRRTICQKISHVQSFYTRKKLEFFSRNA